MANQNVVTAKLWSDIALHFFGADGLDNLRHRRWTFIALVGPVWGFIADLFTVLGPIAPRAFLICAALCALLAAAVYFRTKYCEHCAFPCVVAFILAASFGTIAGLQKLTDSDEHGLIITTIQRIEAKLDRANNGISDANKKLDERSKQITALTAIIAEQLAARAVSAAAPGPKQDAGAAATTIVEGAASDERYAKALEWLKQGKQKEAEPLLKAVAEERAGNADRDAKGAAVAYRALATIAAISEPRRAREYYALAARLDPGDVEGNYWNGGHQAEGGDVNAAEAAYIRVIDAAKAGGDDEGAIWARYGLGNFQKDRGYLADALKSYRDGFAIADRLAKSNPGNAGWQHDLNVSHGKIGDVLEAQGNLPEALKSYRDGLAIADRLAKSDPDNAGWQRDLGLFYERVGDVLVAQGNLPEALRSYRDSLAIADRLAKSDPDDAGWQRDLSESYDRIGDIVVAQGNLPEALKSYRDSLAIADRLTKSDPGNADWQRDLSVSYDKIGDILLAQGNLPETLKNYRASLTIADRLAKSDPDNRGWQRDLTAAYDRIGDVLVAQRNLPEALKSYRDS